MENPSSKPEAEVKKFGILPPFCIVLLIQPTAVVACVAETFHPGWGGIKIPPLAYSADNVLVGYLTT
jgi:hypothetical protein